MTLPRPVRTHGLTHFAIAVRDPRRSLAFYRAVLGVVPGYEDEIPTAVDPPRGGKRRAPRSSRNRGGPRS